MNIKQLSLAGLFLCLMAHAALALTVVPEGNQNIEQPDIPKASTKRTAALKSSFEAKYQKVLQLLKTDSKLRMKITSISAKYDISPLHMVGAIVGEHTYNVDAYDRLQTYYIKALNYVASDIVFESNGEKVVDFVARPQFDKCKEITNSEGLWTCRERVWNTEFRDKTVDGIDFPNSRFSAVFFQPFYSGQTFGIGQMSPLTALQMSDRVSSVSGLPKLDVNDAKEVYRTIMDPDLTLLYMAATIVDSIEAYKNIAGVDISNNPGLTATLYNLGDPSARAAALAAENKRLSADGKPAKMPTENYYGWLVNDKISDLKALF